MTDLSALKPTAKPLVIDLVRDAGVDVSEWSNFKGSNPAMNSHYQYRSIHFSRIHWQRRTADIAKNYRQQREGLTAIFALSDRSSASDRIAASVAGDLPRVSRAIWTVPREAARTWRACGIRTR